VLNSTVITVVGNLTDNPELRFTPSGVPMARFTVAVNPRVFDKTTGEWRDGDASFYNCTAWRQLAENTAQSLSKGIRVIVTGTIAQQRWETDQGEKRSTFAVTAEAVGPDLSYATATIRKTARNGNDTTDTDDPWTTASPNRPATTSSPDRSSPNDTEPATQPGRTPRPVRDPVPASFNDDPPF
jgi:single-strand DNA-binding protein